MWRLIFGKAAMRRGSETGVVEERARQQVLVEHLPRLGRIFKPDLEA